MFALARRPPAQRLLSPLTLATRRDRSSPRIELISLGPQGTIPRRIPALLVGISPLALTVAHEITPPLLHLHTLACYVPKTIYRVVAANWANVANIALAFFQSRTNKFDVSLEVTELGRFTNEGAAVGARDRMRPLGATCWELDWPHRK